MANISQSKALQHVRKFECLGFPFPRTVDGLEALAGAFAAIVGDEERATWLADAVLHGCSRCPTPIELRRMFERKYPPADGKSVNNYDATDLMAGSGKRGE